MQSFSPRICAVCPGFSALMRNNLPSLAAGRHPASCGQKQFIAVPLPDCHPERSRGTCCSPAAAQTFPPQQSVVLSSRAASTFSIVIPSAAEGPAVRRQRPGHFHRDRLPVLSSRAERSVAEGPVVRRQWQESCHRKALSRNKRRLRMHFAARRRAADPSAPLGMTNRGDGCGAECLYPATLSTGTEKTTPPKRCRLPKCFNATANCQVLTANCCRYCSNPSTTP